MDPEQTNPLPFRMDPYRHAWRALAILLVTIIAVPVACTIGGCAPLPVCPDAEARILQVQGGGLYMGFTPEAMAQWNAVIRAEALKECQFRKPGI